jgi:hypothetical protein
MTNRELMLSLIEMFGCTTVSAKSKMVNAVALNKDAMRVGYFVQPEACTQDVQDFIDSLDVNYNSTFYKTWDDVTSRTRFELFIDQIFHYMTTYGTEFALGNGFVPNDMEGVPTDFPYNTYKVISVVTPKEMYEKCLEMATSGIALKQQTVQVLGQYIVDYAIDNQVDVDIDAIKNRELRTYLYDALDLCPNDKFELLRYIVYKATGKTTIIKNDQFLRLVKLGCDKFDFRKLTDNQIDALASIFYRYKDVLLMFKNENNYHVINVIRRRAVKLHKPMKVGYWESILNTQHTFDEVYEKSAELTNFKIITLMQMVLERSQLTEDDKVMYIIRNGKMFVKDAADVKVDSDNLTRIYNALGLRLLDNMSAKACKIKLPANLHIAVPTSEKNFIGNIPFGSYFDMTENNIIGIYWRNEWGTRDFDLSMNDVNGHRIGWNSSYYTDDASIVYSGDMTNAAPEATELLYAKKNCPSGTVYVNRYNGHAGSKYRFFYANEVPNKHELYNYMVDPRNIKVDVMMESDECSQQQVGFVADDKFFFMNLGNGNSRVAVRGGKFTQQDMFNIFARKAKTMLYLDNVLLNAGFTIANEEEGEVPDIDFTNLDRDTLIKLFDK